MAVPASYLANAAITAAISGGAVTYWLVSARRSMGASADRARAEADQITRQAEREAETLRKEAALEARERAHELASTAEAAARVRQQEIVNLEQSLADKTRALADRLAVTDRMSPGASSSSRNASASFSESPA
jgi:ribonuclease Y